MLAMIGAVRGDELLQILYKSGVIDVWMWRDLNTLSSPVVCWSDSLLKLCVAVGVAADGTDVGTVGRLNFGFEVTGPVNKKHKRNKSIQRNPPQTWTNWYFILSKWKLTICDSDLKLFWLGLTHTTPVLSRVRRGQLCDVHKQKSSCRRSFDVFNAVSVFLNSVAGCFYENVGSCTFIPAEVLPAGRVIKGALNYDVSSSSFVQGCFLRRISIQYYCWNDEQFQLLSLVPVRSHMSLNLIYSHTLTADRGVVIIDSFTKDLAHHNLNFCPQFYLISL